MRARFLCCLAALLFVVAQNANGRAEGEGLTGEWRHYAADHNASKYSPLDQIDAKNFKNLRIAWRWESADTALEGKTRARPAAFRATPLMIGGVLYTPTGLHQVAAIDAGTGETVWVYDPKAHEQGAITHGAWHHRGLEYWTDGAEARVILATGARQLISIDVKTGKPDPNFGENGIVDLNQDLGREINPRAIAHNSPVIVCRDTIVVGSIINDFPSINANPPGHVRAYDVRTGKFKWRFNSIPQEGEFGNETWENESWKTAGNTNVWSMMSADDELGYVYLPFGTPTNDYYGGHRLGDNLFGESIVCVEAETGKRVWHFQAVHHGIWDYDFPCAPNLVDIEVDGKTIKAVAAVSKQGYTYVFDRATGEPVWPIPEREVPGPARVPGDRLSKTQPIPTKPPAFERQGFTEDDLIDFTPELHEEAKKIASEFVLGPLFTPSIVAGDGGKLATIVCPGWLGGANWPGASVDPETNILYVQSQTSPTGMAVQAPDADRSDFNYTIDFVTVRGPQGLPLSKPPYRRITAIDLNRGEHAWQVPLGDGPRNHPAIKHLNLGPLGTPFPRGVLAEGGILLTKTLLITFVAQTDENGNVLNRGSLLQAYDKNTGELIAAIPLEETLHGSPMTYLYGGKQYIAITAGGQGQKPELLAFALP